MNVTAITGRLVADPTLSSTSNGATIARFRVAVDRGFKDKDGNRSAFFVQCTAWNKSADFVTKYFKKGDPIEVVGALDISEGTDKDGNKRSYTAINVSQVGFVSGAAKRDNAGANNAPVPDDSVSVSDGDDLPF